MISLLDNTIILKLSQHSQEIAHATVAVPHRVVIGLGDASVQLTRYTLLHTAVTA